MIDRVHALLIAAPTIVLLAAASGVDPEILRVRIKNAASGVGQDYSYYREYYPGRSNFIPGSRAGLLPE